MGAGGGQTGASGSDQSGGSGITLTTGSGPAPLVARFDVACFGGDEITFAWNVTGNSDAWSGEQSVPCDEQLHAVPTGNAAAEVSMSFRATSPETTYFYAVAQG